MTNVIGSVVPHVVRPARVPLSPLRPTARSKAVVWRWCARFRNRGSSVAEGLSHCKRLVQRYKQEGPYYVGICASDPGDRWTLGRSLDRHADHYESLVVLLQGPSSECRDIESLLVNEFLYDGRCVNAAPGGGGLSDAHAISFVYICVRGDGTRLELARQIRGRRFGHCKKSVFCRDLGGCRNCRN